MNDSVGNNVELDERKIINFNGFFAPLRLGFRNKSNEYDPLTLKVNALEN